MKLKEIIWVGSSKKDLEDFTEDIIDAIGYGLYLAQIGEQPKNAKALKGFGGGKVIEIVESDAAGTYRAVYTIKMPEAVFVLHVFQKKSKRGIETPKREMDLIENRLKQAYEIYKIKFKKK